MRDASSLKLQENDIMPGDEQMGTSPFRLGIPPLLERLAPCRSIMLAGAGGGFDVFAGIPLFHHLRSQGKDVYLAGLSFSELKHAQGRRISRDTIEVLPDAGDCGDYFPEKYLSEWFAKKGEKVPIYCFSPKGAQNIKQIYIDLIRTFNADALVLVDGGTDSLMRGDEPGLGTPYEDMASIAAAHMTDISVKLLLNLGFGVDTFHGVCHALALEAIADLTARGAFLGALSLLPEMPELQALSDALEYVCGQMPGHESIVMTSVTAAAAGRFGDYHATDRTAGSRLFINPLMSMYWSFDLDAVARRCLYIDYIKNTYTPWDVIRAINNYRYTVKPREWMDIPL